MKPKDPRDDYREPSYGFAGVQERADELLQVALDLSEAEVDRIYVAAHLAQNLNEKLFGLASRAAAVCHAEHRPRPALQAALAVFAQMELPLENKQSPILPRILLIDSDAERLLERRRVFSERQIETDITTSASDRSPDCSWKPFGWLLWTFLQRQRWNELTCWRSKDSTLRCPSSTYLHGPLLQTQTTD